MTIKIENIGNAMKQPLDQCNKQISEYQDSDKVIIIHEKRTHPVIYKAFRNGLLYDFFSDENVNQIKIFEGYDEEDDQDKEDPYFTVALYKFREDHTILWLTDCENATDFLIIFPKRLYERSFLVQVAFQKTFEKLYFGKTLDKFNKKINSMLDEIQLM
ncbi:MAG TPA: hypothetical protein PKY59_12675 [Pyrinomonadaceae bacterium]|nr:hypothetical protein [Pyrinomonadaceae bacterium]